jgi:hypothetical protein
MAVLAISRRCNWRWWCVALFVLCGCGVLKKQDPANDDQELTRIALEATQKPMAPEQSRKVLEVAGENWLYGQGVGETILDVGTIVLFPPYALFLAGNAVASLSGYEPIRVSEALPDEQQKDWLNMYNGVTSAPGKAAASLAGEEFRTQAEARAQLKAVLRSAHTKENKHASRHGENY